MATEALSGENGGSLSPSQHDGRAVFERGDPGAGDDVLSPNEQGAQEQEQEQEQEQHGLTTFADHLDPEGKIFPTNCWLNLFGVIPTTSLDTVVTFFQEIIREEMEKGIIDLDAPWDPQSDSTPPTITFGQDETFIREARVYLSYFGRPHGWLVRFPNRSIISAILTHSQQNNLFCSWKKVEITEWDPSKGRSENQLSLPHFTISDSFVRFENCPGNMPTKKLVNILSRYDLASDEHPSVFRWKYQGPRGEKPLPTFVVRFADASWARAAIRELQGTYLDGHCVTLLQYPNQLLPEEEEEESLEQEQ